MALNLLVFVAWNRVEGSGLDHMYDHFTVSASGVGAGRVWTLVSSAFSHYDTNHLLFNGIALWIFGGIVGRVWGARTLVGLYLSGAVVSALAHLGWNLMLGSDTPALGASGAVMALSVATAWTAPQMRVLLFFLLPVPMWALVPLYVVIDTVGLTGLTGEGVANAAHLGGVFTGIGWVLLKRRVASPPVLQAPDS